MRTIFLQVAPLVWLLVAGFGPRPTVGQQRDVLPVPNHGHPIWLVFSPDGKLLAAKTDTNQEIQSIAIWDVSAQQVLKTISFSKLNGCDGLAFSPDGKVLATGHSNNGVRLWDLATGKAREPFPASEGNVTRLAFSPDGAVLAAAGVAGDHRLKHSAKSALHGNVTLWTVQTGRQLAILDTGSNVRWTTTGHERTGEGRDFRRSHGRGHLAWYHMNLRIVVDIYLWVDWHEVTGRSSSSG